MSDSIVMRRSCWLPKSYTLVIAEKPKAARKIAEALAEGSRPVRCIRGKGVPFWIVRWRGSYLVIGSAAGHLYGLTTNENGFPVFNYYWAPLWKIDDSAKYTRKFLEALAFLAKRAEKFINACDYDIEGSVIGFLVIKFLGDPERALRVRFSALTSSDIIRAFTRPSGLDWEMIEAGLARHELDWLWGINISRALMESVKASTGKRVILSAGRVQSPTLSEAVKRTVRRNLFVPIPRFNVYVVIELGSGLYKRVLVKYFDKRNDALAFATLIRKNPVARVSFVETVAQELRPPAPFNLGDLQAEASRIYGYDPHFTQNVAEQLYLDGLISYPRTNSQKIPSSININQILRKLASISSYRHIVEDVLRWSRGKPRPRNGLKEDPAHPAIHPTDIPKGKLAPTALKIYDLIVRRFLASMMPSAIINRVRVRLRVAEAVDVILTGGSIERKGWMAAYPFLVPKLEELPVLQRGEKLRITRVETRMTWETPPELYTKLSLVRWMESVGIGTEATRARIVKLLFDRGYLVEERRKVYATDLGIAVVGILEKYFPQLVSIELTRHFERLLNGIREGKVKRRPVVEEAKKFLSEALNAFKKTALLEAGQELSKALGLLSPRSRCVICGREAVSNNKLCHYHQMAYENLVKGYEEWRKRFGPISFKDYVAKIAKTKAAGPWVREVAKALYEGKLSLSNSIV